MSKSLIGIVSFGGLPFLRLLLDEIDRTVSPTVDVAVVVAKPGDDEMINHLWERTRSRYAKVMVHEKNKGFPASINDLYDLAFVSGDYDNLICCGNDIVPLPGAIEAMIRTASETDYEMICGSEFDARFLCNQYPEARHHFEGENLVAKPSAITSRVWELHQDPHIGVEPDTRKDIRNMTLFKRSSFEKAGYDDVNYWPGGYFADNTYGRKCDLLGVSACGLKEAAFFHWWSRTLHQSESRDHGKYFRRNREFYIHQWHGEPGHEKLDTPFGGGPYRLGEIEVPCDMKIDTRVHEDACIEYWANL